jgi:hypothetical protein
MRLLTRSCRSMVCVQAVTFCLFTPLGISQHPDQQTVLAPGVAQRQLPGTYFGMNLAGAAWEHPWPSVVVGSVRIFDSEWTKIEPQKGIWNFAHVDADVTAAQANHAEVQLVLDSTPTWASARPVEVYPYAFEPPGSRAEARHIADWEEYIRRVAQRYKGRVRVYEMWNEPNAKGSFTGSSESLIQLCRSAYKVLKQVDPSILVVSPSPAPVNGSIWLHSFIDHGGGDTFDVLGFHFYDNLSSPQIHPESIIGTADHLRQMLAAVKLSKPIWNTESGYYIHSSVAAQTQVRSFPSYVHVLSDQESVDAVGRAYAIGWAAGIERFYWYGWGEPQYAIADDVGATQKAATIAYSTIEKWLIGASYVSLSHNEAGEWVVVSRMRNGALQYLIWSVNGKDRFVIPTNWAVTEVSDLIGSHSVLSGRTIDLSSAPRLLR